MLSPLVAMIDNLRSSLFTINIKYKFLACTFILLGIILICINLYGITQSIRKPSLGVSDYDYLRFIPDEVWSYDKSIKEIELLSNVSAENELAIAANQIAHQSLVHIAWRRVDANEYRLMIPIWENYFLYALSQFSGLPQFERYHFADYKRNIRRGVGICGDASTVLSSILDRYDIDNRIISFNGHVIVEQSNRAGQFRLLDPDFGVVIDLSLDEMFINMSAVRSAYQRAGYSSREIDNLINIYKTEYTIFDDTYHFMSKRYIFENVSYIAKWFFPIILILISLYYIKKNGSSKRSNC